LDVLVLKRGLFPWPNAASLSGADTVKLEPGTEHDPGDRGTPAPATLSRVYLKFDQDNQNCHDLS
jgi:hypothetical protein